MRSGSPLMLTGTWGGSVTGCLTGYLQPAGWPSCEGACTISSPRADSNGVASAFPSPQLNVVPTLIVRDAAPTPADADALARLCVQLGYPAEPGVMIDRVNRLARDENARALVAQQGNDIIGLTTIHLRYTINHEAPIAQLTLLVVDESNRTHGVGRALVEAAEAWARERGSKRIVVTTALQRAGAHAFYEKLSYAHTGRRYGKDFQG